MKTNVLACLFAVACLCGGLTTAKAQTISIVPNPTQPPSFTWTSGGALSGYTGTPVLLNNKLVLEYNRTVASDPAQITQQLVVYTGGDSLHQIANPDAGQGVYFRSIQTVFDNKLFVIYLDAAKVQRLASFDGTSITLYPNPDAGVGYIGSPRIFNNKLYVAYSNAAGVTQFGFFNGTGITLIANPDNSSIGFYNNYSAVFGNKLVSRYVTAAGPKQLATFDGTAWTILPNPDNTGRGVQPIFPIAYKNKLYFTYYSATAQYQYLVYDGTNNPTLIPNPANSTVNNGGVTGYFSILYNDTLFLQYYNTSNVYQLAKFDGSSISLVPNADNTIYGYWYTPIVYNNNLYILYLPADGSRHLAQYVTAGDSLHVIPNPDGGLGYYDKPIVYDNKLYLMYQNAQSVLQLGYFDGGNSLKLVPNPTGAFNGAAGNNGYTGEPIIYNDLLYMQFGSVPYANAGNLAYFNGSTLPLTLLNFTGQLQDRKVMLQWRTTNEINTSYFVVEKSNTPASFSPLENIAAAGSSSASKTYSFTDVKPTEGKNYYRLKTIDKDGKFSYSNTIVVEVKGNSITMKVFPNPVSSVLNIQLPASGKIDIQVYNVKGEKVISRTVYASGTGFSTTINTAKLAAGLYHVSVMRDGTTETSTFIKK